MVPPNRKWLFVFALLAVLASLGIPKLRFVYDFERFFPEDDPELEFYMDFRERFESDDNFLLIAVENPTKDLDSLFLNRLQNCTESLVSIPEIIDAHSIANLSFPVIMGDLSVGGMISRKKVLRIKRPQLYAKDSLKISKDPRILGRLVSSDFASMVIVIRTVDTIKLSTAQAIISHCQKSLDDAQLPDHHFLGVSYFMTELVRIQRKEFALFSALAGLLVLIILIVIFRKPIVIGISLVSIGLGMLLFVGLLGLAGAELDALATLFPILMIIVGTSDVVHFVSRYQSELLKGMAKKDAMRVCIREIGWATFLTSITTALGFASLFTSKIVPIKLFGLWAAVGVFMAYLCVLLFTTSLLSLFGKDKVVSKNPKVIGIWEDMSLWFYRFTKEKKKLVLALTILFSAFCVYGLSRVSTNYSLDENLPRGYKLTEDFRYFETNYSGFRPYEISLMAVKGDMTDSSVVHQIQKLETFMESSTQVENISSIIGIYKSLHMAIKGNRIEYYKFPEGRSYKRIARMLDFSDELTGEILLSKDKKYSRLSGTIPDLGAEELVKLKSKIQNWVDKEIDASELQVEQTGMGLMANKNAEYAMDSLFRGLGLALVLISVLMAVLFRNWKYWLIALLPNTVPLILAGAIFGWLGINLDVSMSIVFVIVFGIAVDDTIHFLSKFKICRNQGMGIEESLEKTFRDTGKAIILTSVILFFGFIVLLLSSHPPTNYTGMLIGLTLMGALIADFLLIPLLIRAWIKD